MQGQRGLRIGVKVLSCVSLGDGHARVYVCRATAAHSTPTLTVSGEQHGYASHDDYKRCMCNEKNSICMRNDWQ